MAQLGVIIVDHGSRRAESNQLLDRVVELFAQRFASRYPIVEPAHMEMAEPSIASAYARCVARGAGHVLVCPFFLSPGMHWTQDIPELSAQAAAQHPGTTYHVAPTLGVDDLILDLLDKRAQGCVAQSFSCEKCSGTLRQGKCGR